MTEEGISKKLHPVRSLAGRVLLISLGLLVLPLFFHSLFLYWIEYKEDLEDIQLELQILSQAEVHSLQLQVQLIWNELDSLVSEQDSEAQKLGVRVIDTPPGAPSHFFLAIPPKGLVVGKVVSFEKTWAVTWPFSHVLQELESFQNLPFSVEVALMDTQGNLLAGEIKPHSLVFQIPVEHSNFSLAVSVDPASIQKIHIQSYIYRISTFLFFLIVLGGSLVWLLSRRMARPLNQLSHVLERVSQGAVHVRYQNDRIGFEINELGGQFNQTLEALLAFQKLAEQEKIQREKLAQELHIGREIQMSLLPKTSLHWKELDIAAGFHPALEVGGDFYDYFPLKENKLFIVMADTAGKGISACLYALVLRSFLQASLRVKPNLSEALFFAHELFFTDAQESGVFITLWAGIYDRTSHLLTYASLGHPFALLKRGDTLQTLQTNNMALGIEEQSIATQEIVLQRGDLLFLYTDGIIETQNTQHQLFGHKRLESFFKNPSLGPPQKIIDDLFQHLKEFQKEALLFDDTTCLALKIQQ